MGGVWNREMASRARRWRYVCPMTTSHDASVPSDRVRPLRRAEYDHMVGLGMFRGEKIELLHGRLVTMSPQGKPHAFSVTRLTKLLVPALGDRAQVRVQAPFAASAESEPEPDIAVVPPGDYLAEHPRRALLLIEVAESSLQDDRRIKGPMYAAAGVPEYWIVDLAGGVVEVHKEPHGDRYASVTRHAREETLVVPGFEDVRVHVGEIVPPRRP
jgi:Uma2 family endonuclease